MDTVSSMDAVSRRQVLAWMAVGVAAVGAVVAGLIPQSAPLQASLSVLTPTSR